ncbi:SMC family ATPase [Kitasatospora cheerisanensis]|uniref:SMC family ATPase n=1 Tax=Kitasatospora cheerisanensis TaxID=81942 RepID=UPI000A708363
MRLHRLTVTAFGPFASTERIDFDRLTASGLFLLRGATGAGKSSVLDAVCYALYGELPGSRKSNGVRSDHADQARRTEVVLEATLGGRRLEITRCPEQSRPKKRGSGFTQDKAQTLLREWVADAGEGEPGWVALSRSHQEAGEELTRLLGMSRDQFCQVVLLPQGDFARFLRADSKQRADLLGKLFDTGRFEQLERWTADRRLRQEHQVQAGRQQLRDLVARAEEAAGPLAADAAAHRPGDDASTADALAWAAMLRGAAAERVAATELALEAAERARAGPAPGWTRRPPWRTVSSGTAPHSSSSSASPTPNGSPPPTGPRCAPRWPPRHWPRCAPCTGARWPRTARPPTPSPRTAAGSPPGPPRRGPRSCSARSGPPRNSPPPRACCAPRRRRWRPPARTSSGTPGCWPNAPSWWPSRSGRTTWRRSRRTGWAATTTS